MRIRPALYLFLIPLAMLRAQSPRDGYRAAYQAWRQTAPLLEANAGTGLAEFPAEAQRSSKAAADYFSARSQFVGSDGQPPADQIQWAAQPLSGVDVSGADDLLAPGVEEQRLLANSAQYLNSAIANFAGSKDTALQQIRQAMERERAAAKALTDATVARSKAMEDATTAAREAGQVRASVAKALESSVTARAQSAELVRKQAGAWQSYYDLLVEGAALGSRTTTAAPPARPIDAALSASANLPAPAKPSAAPRTSSPQPQSARYVGTWNFPARGQFFGAQPTEIELTIDEDNGRLTGHFKGRFAVTAGGDPNLEFTFSGPLDSGRAPSLPLQTADGAMGMMELIPGGAFNLLEVNLQIAAGGNKLRAANFVLLKQ